MSFEISKFAYLFDPYDQLVKEADEAFQRIKKEYPDLVKCKIHCSDCCYAIFGIFLIEALFLKYDFERLDKKEKEKALLRAREADAQLRKVQERLRQFQDDPYMINYVLAKERVRCPLLSEKNECILYPYRPIMCRVYGIPILIRGSVRVCYRSGFEKGKVYTTYNLDKTYRELYSITKEMLNVAGVKEKEERASLMISVSKAITTPFEKLVRGEVLEDTCEERQCDRQE